MAKYEPEHILTDPSFDKAKRQIAIWYHKEKPEKMKKSQYEVIRGSGFCAIRRNY